MSAALKPEKPYRPEHDIIRAKPSPGAGKCRDLSCRAGAEALAVELTEFWHGAGFPGFRAWVEPTFVKSGKGRKSSAVWAVKTNLVGGIPPRSAR